MKNRDDEKSFLKKIKNSLDRSEDSIDAETQSRLFRIRQEALKSKIPEKSGWRNWFPSPLPALATATVILLTVFLVFTRDGGQGSYKHLEDLEILASNQQLEFYEDLDFYAWLAEEEPDAG